MKRGNMPVLILKGLPQKKPSKIRKALKNACAAIAKEYGSPVKHVWATWEEIKPGMYIEGDVSYKKQPKKSHPILGQLLCLEGKSPEEIERLLAVASETVGESLGMPGNVFITYHEVARGQAVSGDTVVK